MQWLDFPDANQELVARMRANADAVFGAGVRYRRVQQGWSQRELARRLDEEWGVKLDPSAITRLERGERPIRLHEAVGLSYVFQEEALEFFFDDEAAKADKLTSAISQYEERLRLNEENLRELAAIVERDRKTLQTLQAAREEQIESHDVIARALREETDGDHGKPGEEA